MPRFRPTSAGWFALLSAAVALAVALTNPGLSTSFFASCFWGIVLGSGLMAACSVRKLSLQTAARDVGTAGHPVSLPVTIHNSSSLRRQPLLVIEDCAFAESARIVTVVPCLAPHETRQLPREPVARRRGFHRLSRIFVVGSDPTGLFYCSRGFDIPREILILPESVDLQHVELSERQRIAVDDGRPIGVSGMGRDFYGIREYRPTDGMRMIHWRASARNGKLMVREFQENSVIHVTILLDSDAASLSDDEGENFEMLIRGVASLLTYLSRTYCEITLVCGLHENGRVIRGDAAHALSDMLPYLATLESSDDSCTEVMDEAIEGVPPDGVLFLFTMSDLKQESRLLEVVTQRDIELRWFHAAPDRFSDSGRATKYAKSATVDDAGPTLLDPGCDLAAALESL
jgi:uncharacterized protein (DUF58 family)